MCELISIIIPAYNMEAYIERCVRSAISQTYRELEILVIDDGSADRTVDIVRGFEAEDFRLRLIEKENGGLSSARNAGLKAAEGRWIVFLDSDDYLEPDCVETLYEAVHSSHKKLGMAGHYVCQDKGRSVVSVKSGVIDDPHSLHKFFLTDGAGNTFAWAKIYDRSVFDELRYEEGRVYEDILIMHHILENAGGCAIVDKPVYDYCLRDGSITYSQDILSQYQGVEACLERVDFYKENYSDLTGYAYARTADFCFFLMGRICRAGRLEHKSLWEKTLAVARSASKEAFSVGFIYRVIYILLAVCPGLMGRCFGMYSFLKNRV